MSQDRPKRTCERCLTGTHADPIRARTRPDHNRHIGMRHEEELIGTIQNLREHFKSKFHREMTEDERRLLDVAERLSTEKKANAAKTEAVN